VGDGHSSGMYLFCRLCGAPLGGGFVPELHECNFERLLEFQIQCARIEIENGLEAQVAAWAREPRLAKRVAFARYMRERDSDAVAHRAA
jgi:hypothetical protein